MSHVYIPGPEPDTVAIYRVSSLHPRYVLVGTVPASQLGEPQQGPDHNLIAQQPAAVTLERSTPSS